MKYKTKVGIWVCKHERGVYESFENKYVYVEAKNREEAIAVLKSYWDEADDLLFGENGVLIIGKQKYIPESFYSFKEAWYEETDPQKLRKVIERGVDWDSAYGDAWEVSIYPLNVFSKS